MIQRIRHRHGEYTRRPPVRGDRAGRGGRTLNDVTPRHRHAVHIAEGIELIRLGQLVTAAARFRDLLRLATLYVVPCIGHGAGDRRCRARASSHLHLSGQVQTPVRSRVGADGRCHRCRPLLVVIRGLGVIVRRDGRDAREVAVVIRCPVGRDRRRHELSVLHSADLVSLHVGGLDIDEPALVVGGGVQVFLAVCIRRVRGQRRAIVLKNIILRDHPGVRERGLIGRLAHQAHSAVVARGA